MAGLSIHIRHFLLLIRFLLKGLGLRPQPWGVLIPRHRLKASPEMAFSMGFSQLSSSLFSHPAVFQRLLSHPHYRSGLGLRPLPLSISLPTVFTTGFEISSSTNLTERADLKFVYSSFPSFNAFPTNIYHDQKLQPATTLSTALPLSFSECLASCITSILYDPFFRPICNKNLLVLVLLVWAEQSSLGLRPAGPQQLQLSVLKQYFMIPEHLTFLCLKKI